MSSAATNFTASNTSANTSTFATLEVTPQYAINQINTQLAYFQLPTRIVDTLHLLTPNIVATCLIQLIHKIIVELLPTYDTSKLYDSNGSIQSNLQSCIQALEQLLSISLQHINSRKVVDGDLTHILLLVQIVDAVIQSIAAQRNASGSVGSVDLQSQQRQTSHALPQQAVQHSASPAPSTHSHRPATAIQHQQHTDQQQLQDDLQYLQQFLQQAKQQLPTRDDNDEYDESSSDEQEADNNQQQQQPSQLTSEHELQSMLDALKELTTQLKDLKQQSDEKHHSRPAETSEEKEAGASQRRPSTAQPRTRPPVRTSSNAQPTQRHPSHSTTRRPSTSASTRSASSLSTNRQAKRNSTLRSPVSKLQQTYNRMSTASDRILNASQSQPKLHNPVLKEAVHHADDKLDADLRRHASRSYQQLLRTLNKSDYTDNQKRAIEEELEKGVALRELAAKGQVQRALQYALKHRNTGKRDDADVEQMFADELRNLKHAIQLKQQKINNEYQRQLEHAKHQMTAYRSDEDFRMNAARSEVHKMQAEIRDIRKTALKSLKEINSPSMWGWTQINDPKPSREKARSAESVYVRPSR